MSSGIAPGRSMCASSQMIPSSEPLVFVVVVLSKKMFVTLI